LQTALGREIRIYKVWNSGQEVISSDMKLLRAELSGVSEGGKFQSALDRILCGAGY